MIVRLEALKFRSLRYVAQDLREFHILVGPNASGKSNFLDVISLVGDVLRVGLDGALLGSAAGGVPQRVADPSHLVWLREPGRFELALEVALPANVKDQFGGRYERARYELAIEPGRDLQQTRIAVETLWLTGPQKNRLRKDLTLFPAPPTPPLAIVQDPNSRTPAGWKSVVKKIAHSGNDYFRSETSKWNNQFRLGPSKSALANLPEDESRFPAATWVKKFLMEGLTRIELSADAIRSPSPPGSPSSYLPDGSNLPFVVQSLKEKHPERFRRWLEHMRSVIRDVEDIKTVQREEDLHRYLVIRYQNGLEAPSWVVSDGTLRLLALTLLPYLPATGRVYLIEEPENGIHPRAVEGVYESLSSAYGSQVLSASHSPVLLGMADPADLLCFAKDSTGATDIVNGTDHPQLRKWKGAVDLGTLFATGVLG